MGKRKRSALLNDSVVPSYSLIAVDPPQYKEDINFSQDCIDEDETVRDNEAAPDLNPRKVYRSIKD